MENIKLVKGSPAITIYIATQPTDEENLTKGLIIIPSLTSTGNWITDTDSEDYGENVRKVLDLLKNAEQRIGIDGFLNNGKLNASESKTTALEKKKALKKMFLAGGVMKLTYEGDSFNINMDKLSIKRIASDNNETDDDVAIYSVKFTAIRAEDQ